jgi:hypothetical protein
MHVAAKLTIFPDFLSKKNPVCHYHFSYDAPLGKYKWGTKGQENFAVLRA